MSEEDTEETGICPFDGCPGCKACLLGGPCPLGKTVEEIAERMKIESEGRQRNDSPPTVPEGPPEAPG